MSGNIAMASRVIAIMNRRRFIDDVPINLRQNSGREAQDLYRYAKSLEDSHVSKFARIYPSKKIHECVDKTRIFASETARVRVVRPKWSSKDTSSQNGFATKHRIRVRKRSLYIRV